MRKSVTSAHTYTLLLNSKQVLDALLKEICAALLESDVNVKLVASLRQKVKAKAKAAFESNADRTREQNRKHVVQKVGQFSETMVLTNHPIELCDPSRQFLTNSYNWWTPVWNHINRKKVVPM